MNASSLKKPFIKNVPVENATLFTFINEGQADKMLVYGYRRNLVFSVISWFFTVLTLGTIQLVFHWWPHIMLYSTYDKCHLRIAEKLLIIEHSNSPSITFHVENIKILTSTKMFEFKKKRYIWDKNEENFYQLKGLESQVSTAYLHLQMGLNQPEVTKRQLLYGRNVIDVPMQGIAELLFLEVLNPFYIFQIFSFGLWFAYEYISYAVAILIISASGIIMTVIQTRHNQKKLYSTIYSSDEAVVVRTDSLEQAAVCSVRTDQLVPGDLLLIPAHGCVMHCDAVLLTGTCTVNESILTGESVPVTKSPLPNSPSISYDSREHDRHTLYCGTRVIKTRNQSGKNIYAVVIRTGFNTLKGELVRSILYPAPITFKFEQDSYNFIRLMASVAGVGFMYTVITKLMRGIPATTVALEALDLVTVVVPPALPAAMAVGCMSAQARLHDKNIYCTSPRMINVSGCVDCICFDKTGTLTEDSLDMWGVLPTQESRFDTPLKNVNDLDSRHILYAMATCHSLSIIEDKICGDPLDIKMFEWTGWTLEEPDLKKSTQNNILHSPIAVVHASKTSLQKDPTEIEIIHQIPFTSNLQRMTVITRESLERGNELEESCTVYSKGSPEIIKSLCNPESVPKDFNEKLDESTGKGYRVLGIAYKFVDSKINHLQRERIETDLNFLGLVIFENKLKPVAAGVISALKCANIRPVMVTGDNQLTAVSVARECGIVPRTQRVFRVDAALPTSTQPALLRYTMCQNKYTTMNVFDGGTKPEDVPIHQNVETKHHIYDGNTTIGHSDAIFTRDDSLVLTGATWDIIRSHFLDEVPNIVRQCNVFCRMSPDQKQQLVLYLQSLGYYVGMCGDGANDCGALRAAHAGISLSEAESSVASPFTSKEASVECVIKVIQEGRAALVTSFAIFKYMAGYSITQFVSVMILYSIDSNLTDVQYLFVDLFIISVFAFLLGRTEANCGPLVPRPPETSLMSPAPIASLFGQLAIVVAFQFISFFSLPYYDWFVPFHSTKSASKGPGCYENYALFAVTSMQYVTLAVVFCKGAPYRLPLSHNWMLWSTVSFLTAFIFYLILWPDQWLQDTFELVVPPEMNFRIFCIVLCITNLVIAWIYEYFVCDRLIANKTRSSGTYKHEKEKFE